MTTKTLTAAIAAIEDTIRQEVDLSATTEDAARETVPASEAAAEEASAYRNEIETSHERGETTYTATDHAEAVSGEVLAKRRVLGAQRELDRAQRERRSSDVVIATLVAAAVRGALPGVVVVPTFVDLPQRPRAADLPCVLVVQTQAHRLHPDGTVSGEVEVVFHRTLIHRPMEARAIEEAADQLDLPLRTDTVQSRGDGIDVLKVRVNHASPDLPVIPTVEVRDLVKIGRAFAQDLASTLREAGQPARLDRDTGAFTTTHIIALPQGAQVVSEEIDDDGKRTLTVDTLVLLRVVRQPMGSTVQNEIDRVLAEFNRGRFFPALGRLVCVERLTDPEVIESHVRLDDHKAATALENVNVDHLPVEAHTLRYLDATQVILRTVLESSTQRVSRA